MSNILSLEELKAFKEQYKDGYLPLNKGAHYLNATMMELCETAIEYYRRWQMVEDALNTFAAQTDIRTFKK